MRTLTTEQDNVLAGTDRGTHIKVGRCSGNAAKLSHIEDDLKVL